MNGGRQCHQNLSITAQNCEVAFQTGVLAETACEQEPSSLQDQLCGGTDAEQLTVQARKRQEWFVERHSLGVVLYRIL